MDDQFIITKLNEAIELLYQRDNWLLEHDLSEQCISHKFAEHLQTLIATHSVDCEYNGNVDDANGKKKISILRDELIPRGLIKKIKDDDGEVMERSVFPDIIVHRRGFNTENKCIIEVKKGTSRVSFEYDYIKLQAYTTQDHGNNLSYQLGIFICFETGTVHRNHEIKYFKEGVERTLAEL